MTADLLPKHSRPSLLQQLTEQAEPERLLPFGLAIVLPHALAFLAAHVFTRRAGKAQRELLEEPEEGPKSISYIVERAGPMWLIHMIGIFSWATGAPSIVGALRVLKSAFKGPQLH